MNFETDAARAAYEQVSQWVTQLYGESAYVNPEIPAFVLPVPDMNVSVGIQAMGEDEAVVDFWTWPCGDEKPQDSELRFLLEQNAVYRFGDLNLQGDGRVIFERVEPMNGLTKDRFGTLLLMLAGGAAEIAENRKASPAQPAQG